MSDTYNRYGLSRHADEETKRIIRRACGFGCVCCGFAIATYEHIDPEFKDAKTHDPDRMAYLCGSCHERVTRRFWSKEKVKQARKRPWCITHGKCHNAFDVSSGITVVWLGPNKIVNIPTILQVDNEPLLSIESPEIESGPYRISGRFYDDQGDLLFSIIQNEWFGESANWDIECVGGLITIRKASRQIALQLRAIPPHGILVERADMLYHDIRMTADRYHVKVASPKGLSVDIQGRTIIGGEGAVLFSGQNGRLVLGPGPLQFGEMPPTLPPTPSIRRDKVGRNEMCPCGSGLKYKKCCLGKRN